MSHEPEPTIQDVLVAMNQFSNNVEERFAGIESDLGTIKGVMNTAMVTKNYLDDKKSDLQGDLTTLGKR